MQTVQSVSPPVLVYQVVPLGNFVPQRTPGVRVVTERRAAIHAPRALRGEQRFRGGRVVVRKMHFLPIKQTLTRVPVPEGFAFVSDETFQFRGGGTSRGSYFF